MADSLRNAGDSAGHLRAQIGRAWALRWQGKLDSAVVQDVALAAVTKDPEWEGWDREVAARRMITRAQYDSARAETERMLTLGLERGDRRLQSRAHSIQGTIHSHHGRYQLAAEAADTDAGDALIDRYHFLRGFAASHAEAAAIYRAID